MPPVTGVHRGRGQLEQALYEVVAAGGDGGVTVREVIAALDAPPTYTTVITTLNRLTDRAVLTRHRAVRVVRYTALHDPNVITTTAAAHQMHRVLAAAPDPAATLAHFVAGLSPADTAALTGLLHPTNHPPLSRSAGHGGPGRLVVAHAGDDGL